MAQPDAPTASDRAYLQLRGLLTSEEMRPGDHLGEVAVADRLGVSRTPVRAALQRLELEQLVHRRRTGYVVAGLQPRDVREACDALRLVDTALFQRAADRLATDQATRLQDSVAQMADRAAADDVDGWNAADHTFHDVLASASDHALFSQIAGTQRRRLHRFWTRGAVGRQRLTDCAREHAEVAEAVTSGDHDAIARLVTVHIDRMEDGILTLLEIATPFLPTNESAFHDA